MSLTRGEQVKKKKFGSSRFHHPVFEHVDDGASDGASSLVESETADADALAHAQLSNMAQAGARPASTRRFPFWDDGVDHLT